MTRATVRPSVAESVGPPTPHPIRISAHRGAVPAAGQIADLETYSRASESGADLVEFDVRMTSDGELIALHDDHLGDGRRVGGLTLSEVRNATGVVVPRVEDVLRRITPRTVAHIDLKEVGTESRVAELALTIAGPGGFVLTTLEDASVSAVKRAYPQARVGLSLGRDLRGVPLLRAVRIRASEIFPARRLRRCGADFLAIAHPLARLRLLRFCARYGVDAWVWTVDRERAIRRLLLDPRVAVLVTNRPARSVLLKNQRSSAGGRRR